MSDFSIKAKLDAKGLDLKELETSVRNNLSARLGEIAEATYANIAAKAQNELTTTRLDYAKSLKITKLSYNSYLIYLDGQWANDLEFGFPSYNLSEKLLSSKSLVSAGPNKGKPWVKSGEDNQRFAHVPREHRPFSKLDKDADMNQILRKIKAANATGGSQKFTSTFKDKFGLPLQGKVATANIENFGNITKFQQVTQSAAKKKAQVTSLYMSWRTVSDKGEIWQHPGFKGIEAFKEAELFVEQQLDRIIEDALGV